MSGENSYDVRGRQSLIFRLSRFDREGLIHMVFYRIAVFLALILAASMILSMSYYRTPFTGITKALLLLVWIIFTPQLFETAKAMSLISSRGIVFGKLNNSFMKYGVRKKKTYILLKALPYASLLIWAAGFAVLVKVWFI